MNKVYIYVGIGRGFYMTSIPMFMRHMLKNEIVDKIYFERISDDNTKLIVSIFQASVIQELFL